MQRGLACVHPDAARLHRGGLTQRTGQGRREGRHWEHLSWRKRQGIHQLLPVFRRRFGWQPLIPSDATRTRLRAPGRGTTAPRWVDATYRARASRGPPLGTPIMEEETGDSSTATSVPETVR